MRQNRVSGALVVLCLLLQACTIGDGDTGRPQGKPRPSPTQPGTPEDEVLGTRIERALLRFAVVGDFGSGSGAQYDVARRMCAWRTEHPFDMVLTTGDNIYPDGAAHRFRQEFFEPMRCLLKAGVAFHATLGNHDYETRSGRPELNEPAFGMRGRNYVLVRNGVRLVMVNSNDIRMEWLRSALTARSVERWTMVFFHHPVYSPGPHGPEHGFRPSLPRLFARKGVDLVVNGHDHVYSVSEPMRGIRYVVTGGGGAGLYDCSATWYSAICQERYHFVYIRAMPDAIVVRAVPARGGPFHTFDTVGRQ
jgi:hypothetical protein